MSILDHSCIDEATIVYDCLSLGVILSIHTAIYYRRTIILICTQANTDRTGSKQLKDVTKLIKYKTAHFMYKFLEN